MYIANIYFGDWLELTEILKTSYVGDLSVTMLVHTACWIKGLETSN